MMNKKVCFPHYGGCEFQSLEEAVNAIREGDLYVYIEGIVMYNIRFRDCLRKNGMDAVISMLIAEAPAIAQDEKAIEELKQNWKERKEHIADYDIQCLPRNGRFCIEDCWFEGLEDVVAQVEMVGNPRHTNRWYARDEYKPNPNGLHIGNIWESYPVFDSYDLGDNRSYDNYVFSKSPLTFEMMDRYCEQVKSGYNRCMVHESIPDEFLPILYCDGDRDWVLLATRRQ